jgi:hypothetical protein
MHADGGFAGVELAESAHPMWLGADLDDAVGYLEDHPIARVMSEGKPPQQVGKALTALRAAVAPHVTPDGLSLPGRASIVTARAAWRSVLSRLLTWASRRSWTPGPRRR